MLLIYVFGFPTHFAPSASLELHSIVGTILCIMEICFFSSIQNGVIQPITTIYAMFPFYYVLYVLLLAALHKVEGSLYLVIAAITLIYLHFTKF